MATSNNRLVLDTSVVAKWYLRDEDLLIEADRVFADWTRGQWRLFAPGHFPFELMNTLLRAERRQRGAVGDVEAAIRDIGLIVRRITFAAPSRVVTGGARLMSDLGVSFFDACFLRVARLHQCTLVTAHHAFYRQTRAQSDVLWLGNY
jgi:predicted nucleic acid-binding protein